MAFLAGATDVCGLAKLHDLFVSFMSGNTTMLGVALARHDVERFATIAGVIGLFVTGVSLGTVVAVLAHGRHMAAVSLAVGILLLVPLGWPAAITPCLTLAMGALNAAMQRAGATGVSLTYVTGTLVKFGRGLGELACGRRDDPSWSLNGLLWSSLLAGAVTMTAVQTVLGADTLWPLPLMALLIAAITATSPERA